MSEDVTKKRGRGDGEQQGFSLVGDPGSWKQLKLAGECYGGVTDTGLRRVAGVSSVFFVAGATTLLEAAEAAGRDAVEFVALVKELKCEKRRVEDLLAKGELWAGLKEDVKSDMSKRRSLGAFFDYCKRESQPRPDTALPHDVDERARQLIAAAKLIRGTPEKHKQASEKMSAKWPLLDREDAKSRIETAVRNNWKRFKDKDSEKRDWQAAVVTAASGAGKSRLTRESVTWIEEAIREDVSAVNNISMTFVNGYQLESLDMFDATNKGLSGSIAIGFRVAARLFPQLGVCDAISLNSFRRELGDNVRLCDLRTVMRAASIVHAVQSKPRWVTLVMDEVHFAEHPQIPGCDGLWEGMVGAILNYMIPGEDTAPCLEDNIVLFPVMASTWTSFRRRHHLSLVEKVLVPLPALSAASTMQISQLVASANPNLLPVLEKESFMAFLTTCALVPDGLRIGLETTLEMIQGRVLDDALLAAIAKQICGGFRDLYKLSAVPPAVIEFAMSGVAIPDVMQMFEGYTFSHWLEMGFASGDVNKPLAVPFPTLANDVGKIVPAFDQFVNWGQPFYWQDFEALVPYIIQLRCSSLYRVNANHQATLREIFGSGPAKTVRLEEAMAVVTCAKQWLVKKSGNAQQLKVVKRSAVIETAPDGGLQFGSRRHVFGAANGNVHFDGHVSFETDDNRSVMVFYQAKHTQISEKRVAYFAWKDIQTWLDKARALVAAFDCDVKLFVIVTNKEVRDIPVAFPHDLVLLHQGNLETFFAPCFLASARLAKEK